MGGLYSREGAGDSARWRGAKVALFLGPRLLITLRDDLPGLPWAGHWDFPGGGREGDESPEGCVIRETFEEVGLRLDASDLRGGRQHASGGTNWFFVAHLPDCAAAVRFGDEGQTWDLVAPTAYLRLPRRIPHLADLLADYLGG